METKILALLTFLIISNIVKSQSSNFGITANLGFSQVTSNLPISRNEVKLAFSGNLGAFYELRIFNNSSIGIELLWVQIEGKEESSRYLYVLTGINQEEIIGSISDLSKLHSSYIGIPIYLRYAIGKFGIKPGFQTMIFLFASAYNKSWGQLNGEPFLNEGKTKNIKFDNLDFGPKIGIDFKLNSSFTLRSDFYYGLPDITSDEFPWQRKNRQLTLGVNYFFGLGKEKE